MGVSTIDTLDWALGTHSIVRPETETDPDDDALAIFAADDLADESLASRLSPGAAEPVPEAKPMERLAKLDALD